MDSNFIGGVFIAIGAGLIGLFIMGFEIVQYQKKLLETLTSIKNEEGNKIIPTIKLKNELTDLTVSIWFKVLAPLVILASVMFHHAS